MSKRAVLVGLALFISNAAPAEEMKGPHISLTPVDWNAAAASLTDMAEVSPAEAFATLNAATKSRFPDFGKSPVPVLMPLDIDALRKAQAEKPDTLIDSFMLGGFHATAFFQAGPGGYDAAYSLRTAEVGELSDIRFSDPVYVILSGLGMVYQLDGPALPDGKPVASLEGEFPGIVRTLHESYVRYSFERYGVTYVAAIYCLDTHPRRKILTCKQADRVAERFVRSLKLVGGTPTPPRQSIEPVALGRPERVAPEFTYYSPGFIIPGTGLKKDLGGRGDYTVYARIRFPLKDAPAFPNSQSFNNWGDCDFTGKSRGGLRKKGTPYSCRVNGRPLVFDESAPANYSYPWRDNFCEHRRFFVGQCPGGEGHQGQDIRPGYCKLFNSGGDRCLPYQHDAVAVHDGVILRARKQEAVYLFVNSPSAHIRVRYIHMSPSQLDGAGIVSGKFVREGDVIGKVGNFNHRERGTTYHVHFDMQVPTRIGWVFVNPYMTLVAAYEHLIGARGTEIKDGDPDPLVAGVPPIVRQPSSELNDIAASAQTQENAAVTVKLHRRRHVRDARRRGDY